MKNIISILGIALYFLSPSLLAQQYTLPQEIGAYYQNNNFITAFSTHQERSFLVNFLDEEEAASNLDEPRIAQIYRLMKAIQNQTMPEGSMPNALHQNKLKFHSSTLQQIAHWEITSSKVVLKVRKYALPLTTNTKLIAHYEAYRQNNTVPLDNIFKEGFHTTSVAIHTWSKIDGKWMKDSMEKILLD